MTVKLASVRVDLQREVDGDWVEYPRWSQPGEPVKFKVSSFNHPRYKVARMALTKRMAREYPDAAIPDEKMQAEFGLLYGEYLLHGWQGFDVEYSPEIAAEKLTNPEWRELFQAVEWCINRIGQVEVEFVAAAVKN